MDPEEFERLAAAGRRMYEGGIVTGTLGAVGLRLSSGGIAVTARGARLGFLGESDVIVLDGPENPVEVHSSDTPGETGMIRAVLLARTEAGAVVRSHSPYATALSHWERRRVEEFGGLFEGLGGVAFVPYYRPGTAGLAGAVAEAARSSRVALIERQGPVVWGSDIDDAVDLAEALEAAARVIYLLDTGGDGSRE